MYESEHTKFMREWLQANAGEQEVQRSGRALWWDKSPRDGDARRREAEARVPRKAYFYDAN